MTSRRSLLQLLGVAASRRMLAETPGSAARPFRIAVPKQTLDRILTRVREAHWPDRLEGGWQYGANFDYLKELAAYWTTHYNWRKSRRAPQQFPAIHRPRRGFRRPLFSRQRKRPPPRAHHSHARLARLRGRVSRRHRPAHRSRALRWLARRHLRCRDPFAARIRFFFETQGQAGRPRHRGPPLAQVDDRGCRLLPLRSTRRRLG